MTIKKGEPWGELGRPPADAVAVSGDRGLSLALEAARADGVAFPEVIVTSGDLARTVGATGEAKRRFTIDVGEALVDGIHHYFIAHVVAQPRGRWRNAAAVMNAQWFRSWNLGPKGHPNDGRLDVSEFELQVFEWRKVKARLGTGTHLPHPRIATRRVTAESFAFAAPTPILLDGVALRAARTLAVRVIPDALTIYA